MDLNLTNSQTPIVVSSNTTSLNDRNYTVVANATFTDPSPIEGKGFKVFVRNGTAVIGGTSYTVGSEIIRIFHSGSWANYRLDATDKVTSNATITGATKTKVTYDSKGLVTAGADATTADIADSTNKRYVTDAQLTVIGNTSGVNTGDQTFIAPRLQSVTSSATVTPTSGNDIVRITAQAESLTLANPTGTFVEGQSLIIRIKDNGTVRAISYGADYRAIGVTLPTTTVINKTTYLGCIYNSTDSKFDIVGVCTEL